MFHLHGYCLHLCPVFPPFLSTFIRWSTSCSVNFCCIHSTSCFSSFPLLDTCFILNTSGTYIILTWHYITPPTTVFTFTSMVKGVCCSGCCCHGSDLVVVVMRSVAISQEDASEHLDVATEMPRATFRVAQVGGSTTHHPRHHELGVTLCTPHPWREL